jgi:hypothetical protein
VVQEIPLKGLKKSKKKLKNKAIKAWFLPATAATGFLTHFLIRLTNN